MSSNAFNKIAIEIQEYIENNKDKRIEDYILFIGYQEIGQEDETLLMEVISNIDLIFPLIKRTQEYLLDPNITSIKTASHNLNMFVNQEFSGQLISYIIKILGETRDLKKITFISTLADQSKHSFQKLQNLIHINSTIDKKEDFLYFLERLIDG